MILFFLLFVGVPLFELYLLIGVGSQIGALPTIGLSILTALVGGALVRMQGFSVLMRVRQLLAQDRVPALEMLDGAILLTAGLLLVLPGFLTDMAGFLLLIPALRHYLIARCVRITPVDRHTGREGEDAPQVIEGDFRRERD